MSKTRKTRPIHVRMVDKADNGVGMEEHHDHTNGKECDLPGTPAEEIILQKSEKYRPNCYYHWRFVGKGLCGCPMCTNKIERKLDIKKSRRSEEKAIRESIETF